MKQLRWAQEQRQKFIGMRLEKPGYVNRRDLVEEFRISMPQASADLKMFMQRNKRALRYNASAKRFEVW